MSQPYNSLGIPLISDVGGGGGGGLSNIKISAGTTSNNLSALTFNNANGVSFGLNASTLTATVKTDYAGTGTTFGGTNISASITLNTAGLVLSLSGGAGGGGGSINVSAGTTSNNLTALTFNNSNGISFGLNGSVITGTVATNYQSQGAYLTTAAQSDQVVNSINGSTGTFSFNTGSSLSSSRVGNAITWGLASNITTALQSAGAYLTTAALSNHSHGNPQLNLTNLSGTTASNSAGFTLSLSAGNYLTTARASNDAVGLNSAVTNVTATINSAGLSLNAAGYAGTGTSATNASVTLNSNGLAISVAAPGGGAVNFSAGTTSNNLQTIVFSNSNNVSFGLNGSTITATAGAAGGGITNINVSAGTTSQNLSALTFSNSNGVSFGLNGSVITGTVATNYQSQGAYLTTAAQSNQVVNSINGDTGTFSFNTGSSLSSSRLGNAITWGLASNITTALQSAGAYLTTAALSNHSHGNPQLNLTNLSGTTASNSAGFTLSLSAGNYLTTARASNDAVGLNTALTAGPLAMTINSGGLSLNAASAAGTTTGFTGANISGSMTHNTAGLNLSLSVAAPGGGGAVNFSAGTTSQNLQTIQFVNSNGVTFGLGTGASSQSLTASVAAGGGGGVTMTKYANIPVLVHQSGYSLNSDSSGNVRLFEFIVDNYVAHNLIQIPVTNNHQTLGTSSGRHTVSFFAGVYYQKSGTDGSVISLSYSNSFSFAGTGQNSSYSVSYPVSTGTNGYTYTLSNSSSTNILASFAGIRLFQIPVLSNVTLTPGVYYMGILGIRSSSSVFSGLNISLLGMSDPIGAAGNWGTFATSGTGLTRFIDAGGQAGLDGVVYTGSTNALPNSMAASGFSRAFIGRLQVRMVLST